MSNIIHVRFNGCLVTQCDTVFQWDYGHTLVFDDLELPLAYEVHFANERYGGETVTQIGNEDGVAVPDVLLTTGKPVYAFLYLHDGEDDGYTERVVTMPVSRRGKPTNATPTPVQQDAITEAIAALQSAVSETEENVSLSAGYADEAEGYRDDAMGYASSAEESKSEAERQAGLAENSANTAVESERNALGYAQRAETAESHAQGYAQDADRSADYAELSAERAEQAAATAGYMDFEINDYGHLIYTRTDAVDVDFKLIDGHLVMEVI